MDSVDLQVLRSALEWRKEGFGVKLVTVVETWGSAPRKAGAMLALRADGRLAGSVSGGCVEDDLVQRLGQTGSVLPQLIVYGVSKEEAARFGLPCGGTLRLLQETVGDTAWISELIAQTSAHHIVARSVDLASGAVALSPASRDAQPQFDGATLRTIHGPRWRLLIIGAVQIASYLAHMAQMLDFDVTVCDPREEFSAAWDVKGSTLSTQMPDDLVLALEMDQHTAVVAVTHDPKLDDMALLEALKSDAFYVGALGSMVNQVKRRERLAMFDLSPQQIERLHGPIGLHIGSRTPPEIAVSILAEIIAVRNRIGKRDASE
jgi:xanthine dehydrogenase accessory factor